MSLLDYQQGQQFGENLVNLRARAADGRAAAKIDGWIAYAKRLEHELAAAKLQNVRLKSMSEANNNVVRQLRARLTEVAPTDPMAQSGVVVSLIDNAFRRAVEDKGYLVVNVEQMEIGTR